MEQLPSTGRERGTVGAILPGPTEASRPGVGVDPGTRLPDPVDGMSAATV